MPIELSSDVEAPSAKDKKLLLKDGSLVAEPTYGDVDGTLLMTGPEGLTDIEVHDRLKSFGRNEIVSTPTPKWKIFVSKFKGPMPYMIWLAILINGILQDWLNFVVLLVLQIVNGVISFNEATRAGDAIAALKASLKPSAQVKRNGVWSNINAAELVPGDRVAIGSGAGVPADCKMCSDPGDPVDIDQAALTGESLPVTFNAGDVAKMGSMVVRGENEAIVVATGTETFFGRTAAMIASVKEMAHFDKVLLTIMKAMVGTSLFIVMIVFIFLCAVGENVLEALGFAIVLVIASIPIALPVVSTTTMSVGCKELADKKAIVAELACVEQLAGMNMLCSDKTGTLTLNRMVLQDSTAYKPGMNKAKILQYAALAAKWKEPPKDALDTLVLNAVDKPPLDAFEQLHYVPFDPSTKRTESKLKGPDGKIFTVTKGAPHVILELSNGNKSEVGEKFNLEVNELAHRGIRALAVSVQYEGEDMFLIGLLTFLDPPRPDTKDTIFRAGQYGCMVKMITGDHAAIAKETARQLGMGTEILKADSLPKLDTKQAMPKTLGDDFGEMIENVNGFAQVFPEHKFLIIEALRQRGWVVGMTGDGVNDAPALKRADVGIAVEGATDTAAAAADIVLTAPGLSVMIDAIVISREIFQRIKNYLVFRVAVTYQLLMFFTLSVFAFRPKNMGWTDRDVKPKWWNGPDDDEPKDGEGLPDFFNLPVLALVIIVILNDFAIISIAYDYVEASAIPETWTLKVVFAVAVWVGSIAVCGQMTLLHILLSSRDDDFDLRSEECESNDCSFFQLFSYGQILTAIWLVLSLLDFLSVFSSRVAAGFFFSRKPGTPLVCAAIGGMIFSTILAANWPFNGGTSHGLYMESLNAKQLAFIWAYCLGWFLVQDATKYLFYQQLLAYDFEGIRTSEELRKKRAAIIAGGKVDDRVDALENQVKETAALVENALARNE